MYWLPSTSVRCEPLPSLTNNGYGVQPDQVARAVLLTPPGISRHAASNSSPLVAVSSPATSCAWAEEAPAASAFTVFMDKPFGYQRVAASGINTRRGVCSLPAS